MDLDDYECEGQLSLEEFLWESGYYMALPEHEETAPVK